MRKYMLTKFICKDCGENLEVEYAQSSGKFVPEEPTGADIVNQSILVVPCSKCLEPMDKLRSALKVIKEIL